MLEQDGAPILNGGFLLVISNFSSTNLHFDVTFKCCAENVASFQCVTGYFTRAEHFQSELLII